LRARCAEWGEKPFRATQLCQWLFERRIYRPDEMSNLSRTLREKLASHYDWRVPTIASRLDSEDGASKILLQGKKNQFIEMVILRYENRVSLCVSSQVGCKLACTFCQTGKLGFFRHLGSDEIVSQFIIANDIVATEGRAITHIVFMGMGEPLDNYSQVIPALKLFVGKDTFGLSSRRVTVSTSGIADKILALAQEVRVALAVSLHAADDSLRNSLMPINRRYPLAELKKQLMAYQAFSGDMITIEYILLRGVNCSLREAKQLVRFLHGLRAKINLIPFNDHPGSEFSQPSAEEIRVFQSYLASRGYPAPVRYSKGSEVSAACGQLAAKKQEMLREVPQRRNVVG
jgi:23S rRNA (adenine2503-C2)-methyltransferase